MSLMFGSVINPHDETQPTLGTPLGANLGPEPTPSSPDQTQVGHTPGLGENWETRSYAGSRRDLPSERSEETTLGMDEGDDDPQNLLRIVFGEGSSPSTSVQESAADQSFLTILSLHPSLVLANLQTGGRAVFANHLHPDGASFSQLGGGLGTLEYPRHPPELLSAQAHPAAGSEGSDFSSDQGAEGSSPSSPLQITLEPSPSPHWEDPGDPFHGARGWQCQPTVDTENENFGGVEGPQQSSNHANHPLTTGISGNLVQGSGKNF